MKKGVLFIFLSLCVGISYAQQQQGYVKTKGRLGSNGAVIKGTRLSGAMVTVKGRNAVLSGSNGTFTLTIPGNNFYLQSVQKQGYVITDPDVLSKQYVYSKNPLVLVLEDKSQLEAERRTIERKVRNNLYGQLQEREEQIESLKSQNKITEERYHELVQQLNQDQDENERIVKDMTDRYSSIDFDLLDDFNRRVSDCIINGRLTEADSLLKTKGDINVRTAELRQLQDQNAKDEEKLKKQKRALEKNKDLVQKQLENLAQDCYSKYEMFKMQHMNDSAMYYLQYRADLDTFNLKWQMEVASFLEKYIGDYKMAKDIYSHVLEMALQESSVNNEFVAQCYTLLGTECNYMGTYNDAIIYLNKAENILKQHHDDKSYLGTIYNGLAVTYDNQRLFDKAIDYHFKALEIRLKIFGEQSSEVATCYNNIGCIYHEQNNYKLALDYFQKALAIYEHEDSNSLDIAETVINIGGIYDSQEEYDKAQELYLRGKDILERILSASHPHIAVLYNNLGMNYLFKKDFERALDYTKRAMEIHEMTMGENHPMVAADYSNIAAIYEEMNEYETALKFHEGSLRRYLNTFGENTQGSLYVALEYKAIGSCNNKLNKLPTAEEAYKKALEIEEGIFETPNVYLYRANSDLAWFYFYKEDYAKSREYFQAGREIVKKLNGEKDSRYINDGFAIYYSYILDYNKTKSEASLKLYNDYIARELIIMSVTEGDTPASRQGLSGEYVLLEFGDWRIEDVTFFIDENNKLQGKPKTLVLMKDDKISVHHFDNAIGAISYMKDVPREKRENVMKSYKKWKKSIKK